MLVFAKKMKFLPEQLIIIGCEPKTIKAEIGLSEEVSKATEKVAERILEILENLTKETKELLNTQKCTQ